MGTYPVVVRPTIYLAFYLFMYKVTISFNLVLKLQDNNGTIGKWRAAKIAMACKQKAKRMKDIQIEEKRNPCDIIEGKLYLYQFPK